MEPIVSPWLIYLLGVVDGIVNLFGVLSAFLLIGGTTALVFSLVMPSWGRPAFAEDGWEERRVIMLAVLKKLRTRLLVPGVFLMLLVAFIPSRSTMIAMMVAQNITPDNVKTAVATGKNIHDALKKDVLDIIEAIKKE